MSIEMIVAVSNNGIIGRGNKLPWSISKDMEYLNAICKGRPLVCGPKTYKYICDSFIDRHIIFTGGPSEWDSLIDSASRYGDPLVIGGATMYKKAFGDPRLQKIFLTKIKMDVKGDTSLDMGPPFHICDWKLESIIKDSDYDRVSCKEVDLEFCVYSRVRNHYKLDGDILHENGRTTSYV